jgi:CheY-like chemotaxis protein
VDEAMALLQAHPADLLLVDLNLGVESGLELVARLKASAAAGAPALPPWIAVTADVMPATEQAVRAAGAAGLWRKPIDVSEVLAELDVQRAARLR